MTMSRSRSPPRPRSASPRRASSASPFQPTSPHSAAYEGEEYDGEDYGDDDDDYEGNELTHSEKVRLYIADSPSPTGSPIEEDESILNADELRTKLQEAKRQRGAEYVEKTDIKDVLRVEHERAETLADHLSAYEANVARIKKELAALQAELAAARDREAKKDDELAAVQMKLKALALKGGPAQVTLPVRVNTKCRNYDHPRVTCAGGNCARVHHDDGKVEVMKDV
ncbi:uncharacterized protein J4E84_010292 [Alternaria hordeiaustralica]|uniref:uncharacterized protein n=1 Tax=Alternaria hordeiaustralica TaxID=1187925 RepID=UPI0020C2EB3D|nr:uncharacterized protein J4E84_010292 [Alternaria hordeiaustralica]KAI4674851.1 hypothetical protein J4E84_010292 [Alternaria hordeiaustralica]